MNSANTIKSNSKIKRGGKIILILVLAVLLFVAAIRLPAVFTEGTKEVAFGPKLLYRTAHKSYEDVFKGDLILVNNSHAYNFDLGEKKYTVESKKNEYYRVKNDELSLNKITIRQFNALFKDFFKRTGLDNVTIISAYRDYEYQERLLDERISSSGYSAAIRWVAQPGYSEHHTGLAADIAVSDAEGNTSTFTGEDDYALIGENAWKYGFIRRYPENKTEITGINNEPWHYRYVGKPHAYILSHYDLCLEEYIEYIKQFTYPNSYLRVNIRGDVYQIYYVPASPEGKTAVSVPAFGSCDISGNNSDGFIVTVKR
ncbi:MAG: M15 family metallopeptidase [Clostridia bacterium]|nr:M15 family metallopeptidase [Clostridia bacterium]